MPKRTISPEEFCETFMAGMAFCLIEPRTQRTLCWGERLADACKDLARLRAVMLTDTPNYLAELAKTLELEYRKEHGLFDAVFYEMDLSASKATSSGTGEWVAVAIEHKSNPADAHAAMVRLFMAKAPLRVLITYPGDPDAAHKLLKECAEMLKPKDVPRETSLMRKYAMILGFVEQGDLKFSYWVFKNGDFVPWTS
ncbi:MAG: hypothetical protein V1873_00045 [Verrucomicrobiota bacterium]